jgi:hypothetical protein
MFHKSFLTILRDNDELEDQLVNPLKIYSKHSYDIINTAGYYLQGVKREQLLIEPALDYYIARDYKTNTVYLCYKNILMLDFDNISDEEYIDLLQVLSKEDKSFDIYKTSRGYHVFCTSNEFNYRSKEVVDYMLKFIDFKIDINYIRYCYIRGFCVRLNKKFEQGDECNYTYVTTINKFLANKKLEASVDLHLLKCKEYEDDYNLNLTIS